MKNIFPIKEMWRKAEVEESLVETKDTDIRYKSVHSFHSPCWHSCLLCATQVSPGTLGTTMMASDANFPVGSGIMSSVGRKKVQESVLFLGKTSPSQVANKDRINTTCDPHIQIPQNPAPTHSPSACPGQARNQKPCPPSPKSQLPAPLLWLLCPHSRSWGSAL